MGKIILVIIIIFLCLITFLYIRENIRNSKESISNNEKLLKNEEETGKNYQDFKENEVELTHEQKKWNKMWELWEKEQVDSPYAELMTYQSEINNGGHDQYFFNIGNTGDLQKEMSILENILSEKLKNNLKEAYNTYLLLEKQEDDEIAEEIIEQCDDVFYENEIEINRMLEEYAGKIEL